MWFQCDWARPACPVRSPGVILFGLENNAGRSIPPGSSVVPVPDESGNSILEMDYALHVADLLKRAG
jgi:hypothetical protein